jgi:hypothetical protein
MANASDDTGSFAAVKTAPKSSNAPEFYYVRVANPNANKRALFRSISESRARTWVETHVPTGEEVYLESPNGTMQSYQKGRLDGNYGLEAPEWAPFDPDQYVQASSLEAPGQSAWADAEG